MSELDYSQPCPHEDAAGNVISCSEAEKLHGQDRKLTLADAKLLALLVRAVEGNRRLRWYPSADVSPLNVTIRGFTYKNGNFPSGDDEVRDLYVWCSGTFEHWIAVADLMKALDNMVSARYGFSEPMAAVEWEGLENSAPKSLEEARTDLRDHRE